RAAGHLQHGDLSSLFGFAVLCELFGAKLVRVEGIRAGGWIADRCATAEGIFENPEIEPRRLIVEYALRRRNRCSRRNPPNPVAARNRADLEIWILVFELEIFTSEAVCFERTERHERLVGRLVGANDAESGKAVAVIDDGVDLGIFAEQGRHLLLD